MENENPSQNSNEAPVLSPEEQQAQHDQAMIDKVDEHNASVDDSMKSDEERMFAGKFKSVEDLEKSYLEQQKKFSKEQNEDAEPQSEDPDPQTPTVDEAKEVAANAGIDYSALESEYMENGTLSEDTVKSLEEAGIPKNMVDAYIAGQEAIASNTVNEMYNIVGGEETYNDMIQWAQDTLPESDLVAFNSSMTSVEATKFAVNGLYARYQAEQGPTFIKGDQVRTPSGGYNSKQEMMLDMASPQYARDPAYRANVQRRVALSKF